LPFFYWGDVDQKLLQCYSFNGYVINLSYPLMSRYATWK